MHEFGKLLILTGVFIILIGLILLLGEKFTMFGRLPGDIHISRGNFHFYFPLTTSLILSIILSIILTLIFKGMGK